MLKLRTILVMMVAVSLIAYPFVGTAGIKDKVKEKNPKGLV
ncbi:MAG TPA: hypothetical protein PLT64_09655 [Syntrophales bacterium]|nr:hypothetical protein [Syntrophales bacterium]HOL60109.1 hypothetical protein [Syntrophales bacterium]HPO36190.1 hypothetical protein [Syntrophales bacterium]